MNSNRKSGMTLIEVMITFVILCVVVTMIGVTARSCFFAPETRANAIEEANVWISEMYPEVPSSQIHVTCQGSDTDGNGYVTCSARVGEERINLECYAFVAINPGDNTCRETTILTGPRR